MIIEFSSEFAVLRQKNFSHSSPFLLQGSQVPFLQSLLITQICQISKQWATLLTLWPVTQIQIQAIFTPLITTYFKGTCLAKLMKGVREMTRKVTQTKITYLHIPIHHLAFTYHHNQKHQQLDVAAQTSCIQKHEAQKKSMEDGLTRISKFIALKPIQFAAGSNRLQAYWAWAIKSCLHMVVNNSHKLKDAFK